ncbi:ATP-binding protein [Paenibacillus harenae]|uniref:ATP-binding protein n=1 Tax=Paenibacillus harenae TaxID=306543 RepID=UPI001FE000C4|nr:ATP-binding protein [Paenibacillus harenae]
MVSIILVLLSVKQQGYSYDIRYAPIILIFAYLGPAAGVITGVFALAARLYSSGNWPPAIVGWALIMVVFSFLPIQLRRLTPPQRCAALAGAYVILYSITVFSFRILVNEPLFHLQYVMFVLLGVLIGGLLIESNERLRRAIAEKKDMEKSLEASEFHYRLIAENTSDLITVMDKNHSVRYVSPSHELVLGYSSSELESIKLCSLLAPVDAEMFKTAACGMYEDKEARAVELRFKHREGHWIEFESLYKPVKGEDGVIEHIVMISRDISERKKAEQFLLQTEKLSVIGELAAGVAHEIRNPLTTIKGFLQIYKKENCAIKYNDLLLDELERIEIITSELLSMAKPQAIQLTCIDVRELMEATVSFLTPQARLNHIEFISSDDGSQFPVRCEKNQLKQVFLHILKNAIESMPSGGEIHINLSREAEKECLISIQDQGCGIPEGLIPRLGQPFYSLKEKGTGLGLMISHKIIKQHHGSITFHSRVNEGTLIKIRLPLED